MDKPSRNMSEAPDIPGTEDIVSWFDYWPSFHDAEVISITLDRSNESRIVIHTWESTAWTTREVDPNGYFLRKKEAIITFLFDGFPLDSQGITNVHVEWFNHQNVLSGLSVIRKPDGYEIELNGIYGVSATILTSRMRVELRPGAPLDSNLKPKS